MKTLVNEAVKLGFAGFVDPKSLTIDVKQILGAAAMDTSAIGVVKVRVREAFRSDDYNAIQGNVDRFFFLLSFADSSFSFRYARFIRNNFPQHTRKTGNV